MSLEHSPERSGRAVSRRALSIDEFCDAHGISRSMYYKLKAQGKAPREMEVGTRRLISDEAGADWRRAREAEASAA
jgi:predicted DNA-binding transcriptional regulator AlpA